MSGSLFDDAWRGLRREAARQITGNLFALAQASRGQGSPRQPWNLPAKLGALERMRDEVGAAHPGHNDAGDAGRHAELSRRMTDELGPVSSALVGLQHEIEGVLFGGQPLAEAEMDLHNNDEGLRAGLAGRPVEARRLRNAPR